MGLVRSSRYRRTYHLDGRSGKIHWSTRFSLYRRIKDRRPSRIFGYIGLIGQYAHGNEPSHHIVHLYNYVNQSWKTQQLIDTILHTQYFNNPNGLSGNEDCGQMSALVCAQCDGILSSMSRIAHIFCRSSYLR